MPEPNALLAAPVQEGALALPQPAISVPSDTLGSTALEAPAPALPAKQQIRTYVVEAGDSVRSIAKQFGVTNETVIWANELTDPDRLQIGQTLEILPFTGLIHEVRPGDTLASVANAYDAKLEDVIKANDLVEPFIIVVGRQLLVPGGYRPLPKKVIPLEPAPSSTAGGSTEGVVEAPAPSTDQQAAAITAPVRKLPIRPSTPQDQFIQSIADAAVVSYERTGVPASVTIAQAILESYWGSSRLAREANNYFGIKAQTKPGPAGVVRFDVWEVLGGQNVVRSEAFRSYNTVAESFMDHGSFFLENGRYSAAMAARNDAKQFAREISRAGYATDPAYAPKLIALMDRYNLYAYDE